MENLYGIVHTEDGRYVMAIIRRDDANSWNLARVRQWESQSILKRILLFHHGVYFGISSWWKPRENDVPLNNMAVAADKDSEVIHNHSGRYFDVITHSADLDIHKEALQSNLLGVVPEDAFLVTLPLYMCKEAGDSFISIYGNGEYYLIGITADRKLLASFRMAPGAEEKLSGHVGRIKRYWNMRYPDIPFPDTIVPLSEHVHTPDTALDVPLKRIANVNTDEYTIKAMGVAFAQKEDAVPLFTGQTQESSFRKARSWIYGLSAGLLIIGLCAFAVFSGVNLWFVNKKATYEKEYQKVIANNQEIKRLLKRSNELAETIIRLEDTFSRQTIWGKFLHAIGSGKPDGLFFERLGSEPVKERKQVVRIALSGWTPKESSVTDFIAKLQDMPYVTHITLSSMERNKKKRSIYGFKILCTLLLNEQ